MENRKIRVLIVDDSLLFRNVLSTFVNQDESIEVVGTAADPYEARDKIIELRPDVVTLDVEMPKMDGISFLKKLMPQYPLPVVVVSATAENAFAALEAGAVDYVRKPLIKSPDDLKHFTNQLNEIIKIASVSKVSRSTKKIITPITPVAKPVFDKRNKADTIVAIGASTGGVEAIFSIIKQFPEDMPPVLITQHMPEKFTEMFAQRLDRQCAMEVREAKDGDRVKQGVALIAAGKHQLTLQKDLNGYYVSSKVGEKVSGHCPSVDVLFESVAKTAGKNAIGIILTGMGKDGANGLLKMKEAGAYTIGQDKESCVVYGMPMVAFDIGAVLIQKPLDKIPEEIYKHLKE